MAGEVRKLQEENLDLKNEVEKLRKETAWFRDQYHVYKERATTAEAALAAKPTLAHPTAPAAGPEPRPTHLVADVATITATVMATLQAAGLGPK